jgi:D-glucuronyl C5-epimerase-like protein
MRTPATLIAIAVFTLAPASAQARDVPASARGTGIVYRYYAGAGYRFQPLLSFGNLNAAVSAHDVSATRRLARALLARAVHRGDALYWPYDFAFGGGSPGWTSGFTQAVAAQALARTAVLLREPSYRRAAAAAYRALGGGLLMPLGGGLWIREYSFTHEAILNAQLESLLALESYARAAGSAPAAKLALRLEQATRTLLPQFDVGCWGRYELGGAAADLHYQTYHVDLLRRMALRHPEPIWRTTYLRWRACLPKEQ